MRTGLTRSALAAIALAAAFVTTAPGAKAQEMDSRLYRITKSGTLRVCQYPLYYSISYRNPATGETIAIKASKKLSFAPAKAVKDRLNG